MLSNLLTEFATKSRTPSLSEAALYALLGFLTVFLGIVLLIFIVWLVGKFMSKVNLAQKQANAPKSMKEETIQSTAVANADEISEETVAVITAAIMAYYQEQPKKCEFTVKRIKKV